MIDFPLPILGFAAWSGTGKTTLLSQLIPILRDKGVRVGLVKHAHHSFDIDHPGKDSHTLRKAGADTVVIASRYRIASVRETLTNQDEPRLIDILSAIQIDELDLILVEGFKMEDIPKIELHRSCLNKPYLYPQDCNIIALAEDAAAGSGGVAVRFGNNIERLDLGQATQIADFVERFMEKQLEHEPISLNCDQPRLRNAMH